MTLKNVFMVAFFCSVGYTASFKMLKKGGIQTIVFLLLAVVMVILQNCLGAGLASAFGLDPRLGLATGSIPMVGGHGTAGSFGPMLEELGVANANVVAMLPQHLVLLPAVQSADLLHTIKFINLI